VGKDAAGNGMWRVHQRNERVVPVAERLGSDEYYPPSKSTVRALEEIND